MKQKINGWWLNVCFVFVFVVVKQMRRPHEAILCTAAARGHPGVRVRVRGGLGDPVRSGEGSGWGLGSGEGRARR
jgi:hypothetical protein